MAALTATLMAAAAPPAPAGEGFGLFSKKTVKLTRVSPPAVWLAGNRIAVKVAGGDAAAAGVAQRLQMQLESELIRRDRRFVPDAKRPEVVVDVKVLENRHSERSEQRREILIRKVGTDALGKDRFESYEAEVAYRVVSHSLRAAYRIADVARAGNLDADSFAADFEKAFREGEGAPDRAQLESWAVDDVVNRIARRLTPSRDQIEVLLPRGSLEGLAPLAAAGLWHRYLEALEKRPPSPKPVEESYRLYALGTAHEALGYGAAAANAADGADGPEAALKNLEEADACYRGALEANPEETYFSQPYKSLWSSRLLAPPLERIQSALAGYRRLQAFKGGLSAAPAPAPAPVPVPVPAKESAAGKSLFQAAGASEERLDNAAVIRMVQAGLAQEIVLKAIESAPQSDFDVSVNGLITLSEARVDPQIIRRMQEAASGRKTPRRPEAKRPPPSSASPRREEGFRRDPTAR